MPPLPNARHEVFVQNLARGMTNAEAYRKAGYKPCRQSAYRLARKSHIVVRLGELQGRAAERAVITAALLIELAEQARVLAMEKDRPSAAVTAIKEMGVLAGVRVEKRETAARTLNDMSDDELAQIARGGAAGPDET